MGSTPVPNTVSGFYATVVAAATEASQLLAPTHKLAESIYTDYNRGETGNIGQTINVPIPQDPTSSVADIGAGDVTLTDVAFTTVPIVLDKHPNYAYVVRDFEQFNSVQSIRTVFMDAALKGVKNHLNSRIAALLTAGNLPVNAPVAGTGGAITVTQFLAAMAVLSDKNVPVANDPANMSMVLPSIPYTKLMDSTTGTAGAAWVQAFIAGNRTAEAVRQTGEMPTSFGMSVKLDQQAGATGTAPARTFTGVYMHRWSIACATRPLPPPDGKVVDFTYIDFGGIPIRVSVGYNMFPKQGYIVNVDAGYGLKVVRPEMAVLLSIAE